MPRRRSVSAKFTPIAASFTSTSPAAGAGVGTSASWSTSGPPSDFTTIARMRGILSRHIIRRKRPPPRAASARAPRAPFPRAAPRSSMSAGLSTPREESHMDAKLIAAARAALPASKGAVTLGATMKGTECHPEPLVTLPLAMRNRHGLIAGATGTGKTKTLQLLAEQLSAAGVPVFLADLKGDLSGVAVPGESNDRVAQRAKDTGYAWKPNGCPVEYLSLTGKRGAQLRATVSSFGPLLLSKVLGLNDTQSSVLSLVFKYCDDRKLALMDFSDLRAVLQYLSGDGASDLKDYGGMSKATVGVLLREMVELEQQGAQAFFGEPEFDLHDLMQPGTNGQGLVSVLELQDVQDKPALFSTFMMWMLARLYADLPEVGDLDKPKLVFFFDEAHLLFDGASQEFLTQVEQVVRLIRSK